MNRIETDYIAQVSSPRRALWRRLAAAVPPATLLLTLISLNADAQRTVSANDTPIVVAMADENAYLPPVSLASRFAAGKPQALMVPAKTINAETAPWVEMRVRSGDTIGELFERYRLADSTWREILSLGGDTAALASIRTGQIVRVRADRQGRLLELSHQTDESRTLHIKRVNNVLTAEILHSLIEHRINYASDTIEESDGSLFMSGQKVGLSDRVIMQLFEIFRWDVDFALDIQPGDRYSVVYEEVYRNGEKLRDGNILAAEFSSSDGKALRAVRYSDRDGHSEYYTPSGAPLHKAFIRTPVAFSRISSYFSLARRHPVLNRIRAHKGVDYAAPTGTPIKATGAGRIVFRGRQGGYGNVIMIQHANSIQTVYGHMSRFAKGLSVGSRVTQSQVIGFVGMTGLATGPHLHYEFRVNGRHVNPLTAKLPYAAPLPPMYRADFERTTAPLLAQLDSLRHFQVAQAGE